MMQRFTTHLSLLCLACLLVQTMLAGLAYAQNPPAGKPADAPAGKPADKPSDKTDLTEGLLDLLREPVKGGTPANTDAMNKSFSAGQPSARIDEAGTKSTVETAGEDIGQGPANPLAEVQRGMNTLAQWMRSKSDVAKTKALQRDVVLRLDEMIGELEKQSTSSQSSASTGQSSQSSPSLTDSSSSPTQAQKKPRPENAKSNGDNPTADGSPGRDGESGASQSSPSSKSLGGGNDIPSGQGQPGVSPIGSRNAVVDLNDPRALQRSAWGNLPERTREQMQSRMVERFLPAYRDEIEAYYRALVK